MRLQSLVLAILIAGASPLPAMQIDVDSTLDEIDAVPGDSVCSSTPSGVCTLRAAVMEANGLPGFDVIILPAGVFTLSIAGLNEDVAASGDLDLRDDVAIYGAGAELTIIDANNIDRVFEIVFGNAYLDSLTIQNGLAVSSGSYRGGGVLHRGSQLTLLAVRVTGNTANSGGGVYVPDGPAAEINSSSFDNNSTEDSGFTNDYGAAIYSQGELDLSFSTVSANSNQSGNAAAVFLSGCSSTASKILNATIADNSSRGLYVYNCDLDLSSTTIARNAGTGLVFGVYSGLGMSLTASNTIIANNGDGDCNLTTPNLSFASCLSSDNSCGLSLVNGDLPNTDPVLLPLRNWGGYTATMYPLPGLSPVIDAGDDGTCPGVDQRNHQRPEDGDGNGSAICDIGSVEAGDLVFWGDFEDGTTDRWSGTVGTLFQY